MSVSNLNSSSSQQSVSASTSSAENSDSVKKNHSINSISKRGKLSEESNSDFSQLLMNDLNSKINNEKSESQKNFLDKMLSGNIGVEAFDEQAIPGLNGTADKSNLLSKAMLDQNKENHQLKQLMNLQTSKKGDPSALDLSQLINKSKVDAKIDPEQLNMMLAKINSTENGDSSKLLGNQNGLKDLLGKDLKNQPALSINQHLKSVTNPSILSTEDVLLQNGQMGELDKKQILKLLKNYEKLKSNENVNQFSNSLLNGKRNQIIDEKNVKNQNEQNAFLNNQNQLLSSKNIELSKNGFESQFSSKDNPNSSLLEQLTTRITDSLKLMSAPPMQQSMSFSLNHAELGAMRVDIRRLGGDRFSLNMSPDELQTHKLLMDNKDSILQALTHRGISIADLTIDQNQLSKNLKDSSTETNSKMQEQHFFGQTGDSSDHFSRNFERQSGRDKRQDLWNYMKQQREVRYA